VRIPLGGQRKRQRQERNTEFILPDRILGVHEPKPVALPADAGDPDAVQPDGKFVGHYQSALSSVILTPSSLSTRRIRLTCSVSFPRSRSERYVRLRPVRSASSAWESPLCRRKCRMAADIASLPGFTGNVSVSVFQDR
jgi:hypothetical protein